MKIIHHCDPDGWCSASIIHSYYYDFTSDIDCYECDYGSSVVDEALESVQQDERVFIVDFSLPSLDEWDRLLSKTKKVVWIDHHKSALQKFQILEPLPGIRNTEDSASLLTWNFLYGKKKPIPKSVVLIDDYDSWKHEHAPEDIYLHHAVVANHDEIGSEFWTKLLSSLTFTNELIEFGKHIDKYKQKAESVHLKNSAFETEINGLKTLCLNSGVRGSLQFGDKQDAYDLLCVFYINKDKKVNLSLYSVKESVDCSKLATKLGGGGHRGAAGANNVSLDQFLKFINF